VNDVMHHGNALPLISRDCTIAEALMTMSAKRFGCAIIVDEENRLAGFYSDGDLRRTLEKEIAIKTTAICKVMTPRCQTIAAEQMAVEALNRMQERKITALVVTDAEQRVTGLIHMHDLLRHGIY
jgi:arabinose-5-phosphate isomerase